MKKFVPNAVFVSLNQSFLQLVDPPPAGMLEGAALRNMTCGWWRMSRHSAAGVRYVLGVFKGQVVSLYETNIDSKDWPSLPAGVPPGDEGRLYIPAYPPANDTLLAAAKTWSGIPQLGPAAIRYADLVFDAQGALTACTLGDEE